MAALGATAGQHGSTIGRFHAHSKAVRFCALPIIRLKGTFWHYESLFVL
jgi:hypothetical protein